MRGEGETRFCDIPDAHAGKKRYLFSSKSAIDFASS